MPTVCTRNRKRCQHVMLGKTEPEHSSPGVAGVRQGAERAEISSAVQVLSSHWRDTGSHGRVLLPVTEWVTRCYVAGFQKWTHIAASAFWCRNALPIPSSVKPCPHSLNIQLGAYVTIYVCSHLNFLQSSSCLFSLTHRVSFSFSRSLLEWNSYYSIPSLVVGAEF